MKKEIDCCLEGGILRIGINRPEKKNALTQQMYADLAANLLRAEDDEQARVVLLHGTPDCFTSGNDIGDFVKSPPTEEDSPVFRFLDIISRVKKPIVAVVNGPAIGVGTTMLLHCDLVYAGESAVFQLPFVNLGLCPEAASSYLLPKLIGHQRASELLLLGEPFSAGKAAALGIVNEVHPDGNLMQGALRQARKLAKQPSASVCLTKALLKQAEAALVAETMEREGKAFLERLGSKEAANAFAAFLNPGRGNPNETSGPKA